MTIENTKLELLAFELAKLNFDGLSPDQIDEQMNARLAGLSDADAETVVQHAAAIARGEGEATMKLAAALETFGTDNEPEAEAD